MRVTVKLYSLFRLKQEKYDVARGIQVEMEEGSTILDLLHKMEINPRDVSFVRLNEEKIIKDWQKDLQEGEIIEVFPFFGGG